MAKYKFKTFFCISSIGGTVFLASEVWHHGKLGDVLPTNDRYAFAN